MLPGDAYQAIARAAVAYLGDAIMQLLAQDGVPAYNMYSLFRTYDDVTRLVAFADGANVTHLAVRTCPDHACSGAITITINSVVFLLHLSCC